MIEKKRYRCLKCKFPFTISSARALKCPNCGSGPDLLEEITRDSNSAQKMVDNSDSW